jgi:F0F1-type ATP synthase assembly protein I
MADFVEKSGDGSVTSFGMLAPMEPTSRPTFQPAGAGMLLAATTATSVAVGALIGWIAGNVGYGILGGAIVGVPAGITAVYFRYREALS